MPKMTPTHVEIEAKLIVPEAATLKRLPKALRDVCCSVKNLGLGLIRDTYYDTSGWHLYQAGFACRVRRTRGQATLVLKSLRAPKRGVSVRDEYEHVIGRSVGGFMSEMTGPLGSKVRRLIRGERLCPIFSVRNSRRTFEVVCEDGLVAHVCADDFTVSAGANSRQLAELELEVVSGNRSQLQRLTRALSGRLKLAAGSRAKYQQGLDVGGHRPGLAAR